VGTVFFVHCEKENDHSGFDNQLHEILQQVVKINVIPTDQRTSVRQYPITAFNSSNQLFKPLPAPAFSLPTI
jgi:hypothetical protein